MFSLYKVGEMLYVLEYEPEFCKNLYGNTLQISIVFACKPIGSIDIKPPTIPDQSPENPAYTSKAVWMPMNDLKNIEYVPYIHNSLMKYVESGVFAPNFLSEPLNNDAK